MIRLDLKRVSCSVAGNRVLRDVNASFNGGELTAIIGKNGAGKTTLIKSIAHLMAYQGRIEATENGVPLSQKQFAYLPQLESVTSTLTAFETVLLGLTKSLGWRVSQKELAKTEAVLANLGLEKIASSAVRDLSGGQKQMVFLAQAFVSEPKVLLLDEPTSALDIRHQLVVMQAVKDYCRRSGAVGVFVVHDLMLASRFSAKIMLLHNGVVDLIDHPDKVLQSSKIDPIYQIESLIEKNSRGLTTLTPIRPIRQSHH